MTFTAPVLEYALLAPILIVLAGALLGVLVEAFVKSSLRLSAQIFISVLTVVAAFVQLMRVRNQSSVTAAMGSVTFDGAGVLLQAAILVIALISLFLIADQDNFTAAAGAVPGSLEERQAAQAQTKTTEVFPLTLSLLRCSRFLST
jgi:NADH-quinone oxidoreductase subunit N